MKMPPNNELIGLAHYLFGLVTGGGTLRADSFVWHVTGAAFDAVVDAEFGDRTKRLVVEGGHAKQGTKFLIKLTKIFEVSGESRELNAFIGDQEFLVARVPQAAELAIHHDCGENGHLKRAIRFLA